MEEAIPKKPVPSNGSSNVRVNVVINLIRTLTLTILSFITFPYVCRILGDSTLGLYTWVNTFVYYFLILAKISIPNIAIRECVKVRDDKKAFSHKVQEFFLLQAFMTILSFGLMVSIMAGRPRLQRPNLRCS
jgi:O-antigen/teichoic acid export membrane protein